MLVKVFLTFWLALALLAAGQEIISVLGQRDEQAVLNGARSLMNEAQRVVDAYAQSGVAAARTAAERFESRRGTAVDLLDADRRSLFGREVRPAAANYARLADRAAAAGSPNALVNLPEHIAARQIATPDGRHLTLVLDLPRASSGSGWMSSAATRYAAVLAIGGLLCFALARHFSRPLIALADATNTLADGRLHTRVGRPIAARRDEIGRLAHDFDRMAERIEALVAGQRRLLGDVSHELRSPLARLTVATGLARRESPASAGEYFDRIDTETARVDRLIEQLLTLARSESGVAQDQAGVNLTDLVQQVVADGDFEARARGRRVALIESIPVTLHGRPELLRSAVENIVRNGIRHTSPGSQVDVAVQRVADATATCVRLTVRDHGPGVPDSALADVFKRFWRAEIDGQTPANGAGLGLAIAESVVRTHGGSIAAANADGGGLLVTIDLPVTQ